MIDYDNLDYHPATEAVVTALCERIGREDRVFFRNHVSFYLSAVAGMMRTSFTMPGSRPEPVNMFAINLAYSGFGKTWATNILENEVVNQFRDRFLDQTLPLLAEKNFPKIAVRWAARKGSDPDEEEQRVRNQFQRDGDFVFSYDSATAAALKQFRNQLLLANAGSMNLVVDEIAANLSTNKDAFGVYLELFNGITKSKLVKNTADHQRSNELFGVTPTNMLLFGLPAGLFDGSKIEEEFITLLTNGYARRCFFAYLPERATTELKLLTPEEKLQQRLANRSTSTLDNFSLQLRKRADVMCAYSNLAVPDETAKLYFAYENDCILRANDLRSSDELLKAETENRPQKTMKVAGAYAFIDGVAEITPDHFRNAIALAEDSGNAFKRMMNRDRTYVRLAKHIASTGTEVTQSDLDEDLSYYKGTKSARDMMMTQAIAWGYKNNIIIKRRYTDSIEFFRGETLKPTDLSKLRIAYSPQVSGEYNNDFAPWDQIHKLTQVQGLNWITHHLNNGHRHDDNCLPGFNLIVIDVDGEVTWEAAKTLLKGYKAHMYTTKRHTPETHRFRIIMPTNYELQLEQDDFKEFMKNLFEWLPFDSDSSTGQRARKWLSNKGHYETLDGEVLDVLPFIPKTSKNDQRRKEFASLQSLDNLERWVIQNTGDGNRNNQLLRYALILMDNGYTREQIQDHVLAMNSKLSDSLKEEEVLGTIMVTVARKLQIKEAA